MAFCPLDYRYGCQDFKHIWSELGRHERQLEVERALIWAHWQLGRVTEADYEAVAAIANPTDVTKERVSEIEAETRHDIMALTKAMAEACRRGRVVHSLGCDFQRHRRYGGCVATQGQHRLVASAIVQSHCGVR